jgi:hypothetical protein
MRVSMHGLTISERGRYDKELGLVIRNQGVIYLTMFLIDCIKNYFRNLRKGAL